MNVMESTISVLVNGIKGVIVKDMEDVRTDKGWKVFRMLLRAYNDYQESERDGVDYIFDINNTDDVIHCISGGMTMEEMVRLWNGSQSNHTEYFLYGVNYDEAKVFYTYEQVVSNLIGWLDEVLSDIIAYPWYYDSYKEVYTAYVSDVIIGQREYSAFNFDNMNASLSDIEALARLKRKLEMGE